MPMRAGETLLLGSPQREVGGAAHRTVMAVEGGIAKVVWTGDEGYGD